MYVYRFKDRNGRNWARVTKRTAKKIFLKGRDIFFIPSKANPLSAWDLGLIVPPKKDQEENIFDQICDAFEYYNCNTAELGKKASFYAEVRC